MEEKRMRRSSDKMIAGVCAGLAEYFNIDPVLMRVAFALAGLFGGIGVPLYIILWLVMPEGESAAPAPAAQEPQPESGKSKK